MIDEIVLDSCVSRVGEVRVERPDRSRMERGSGFLLSGGIVLTTWRVVAGATAVTVVFDTGRGVRQGRTWTRVGNVDLALIRLDDAESLPSVDVAGLGDRCVALTAAALGFPRWRQLASGVDPDRAGSISGPATIPVQIVSGSDSGVGVVELIVAAAADTVPGLSPWEGMVGGPVFCGQALVAVITDHPRLEESGRLSGLRLDTTLAGLDDALRAEFAATLGVPADGRMPRAGRTLDRRPVTAYLAHVRDLVPAGGLRDRERELRQLADFCVGEHSYGLWLAPPWAGKTALMAAFALDPPAGVVVMPFFVTARLAGQSDSTAFTEAILEQAAVILGDDGVSEYSTDEDQLRLEELAAYQVRQWGQRLVLLVDGLDADTGAYPGSPWPSIASVLPDVCLYELKVIVTGRLDSPLPDDLPQDHPLRGCPRFTLSPSRHAAPVLATERELNLALTAHPDSLARRILGLIAASGGGLTLPDLEHLTGAPRDDLVRLLGGVFGRIVNCPPNPAVADPQHAYLLAHDTLHDQVLTSLADAGLARHRDTIHAWAEGYRRAGWPSGTPLILLTGYPQLLHATGDLDRLADLAVDQHRHDRMLDHARGERLAIAEVGAALRTLAGQDPPDLVSIVRIARRRDALPERNKNIPIDLPAAWAALGKPHRAAALAHSIADPSDRVRALTALVDAVAATDPALAERFATDAERTIAATGVQAWVANGLVDAVAAIDPGWAERIARSVSDPFDQPWALRTLVNALTAVDPARAEQVARTIPDPSIRGRMLSELAKTCSATDLARAERIAIEAEQIARTMSDPFDQASALAPLVGVWAATDPTRAERIATDAEQIAYSITDVSERGMAFVELADVVTDSLPTRAEQIARAIPDPTEQAWALINVARALARTVPARAEHFMAQAEQTARTMTGAFAQASALIALVETVADTHPGRAEQLIGDIEQIARTIDDPSEQADALTRLIGALAGRDPSRAERIARTITDPPARADVLSWLVDSVAATDPALAVRIARTITDPPTQADALTWLVDAVAATDPALAEQFVTDAERAARAISDPCYQAPALTALVEALASTDAARATLIATEAERAARAITDPADQAQALATLVDVLAAADPTRAEQIARTVSDPSHRASALLSLVDGLATTDPARAEQVTNEAARIARTTIILDPSERVWAWIELVAATAATDPAQAEQFATTAEQIAATITDEHDKAWAVTQLMEAVAPIDPARAEQIARSVTDPAHAGWVLAALAKAVAACDPARAAQIANEAERVARAIDDPYHAARTLDALVEAVAASDPARAAQTANEAERVARAIDDPYFQTMASTELARVLAALDPTRAEQIARTITDPHDQADALAAVAKELNDIDHRSRLAAMATALGRHWAVAVSAMPSAVVRIVADEILEEASRQPA
jgi:hypothetical protein